MAKWLTRLASSAEDCRFESGLSQLATENPCQPSSQRFSRLNLGRIRQR